MNFKNQSFTLMESMLTMTIIGLIAAFIVSALKPTDIKNQALKKNGLNTLIALNIATKTILAKNSRAYTMTSLKNTSGTAFSLTDSNKHLYLSQLYQLYLGQKTVTISNNYKNISLKNESGTAISNYKVSTFSNGIVIKNGTYLAFKLYDKCTVKETDLIYDPTIPNTHTLSKSCGLIFYDVNGPDGPNIVGIDMYIVSLEKGGLK